MEEKTKKMEKAQKEKRPEKKQQDRKQPEKKQVNIAKALAKAGNAVRERFMDVVYFGQDAYSDFRFRQKKAKRKREHMKQTLSPEKYKAYRKREIRHNALLGIAAAVGFILCVLLLAGLVKLIGFAGSKLFDRKPAETEILTETEASVVYPEKDITIGSTGCMLLHSPFIDSYPDAEGNYDFSSVYKFITPYYSAPDYMTCEFEGALGGEELGYSGYPSFKSPDIIIENIRDSGVDLQFLATNHIYDGWTYGFNRTMEVYEEKGIAYTGIRKTENDKHYYVADINGIRVGFVNYVYETTSQTDGINKSINGMTLESQDAPLLNSFDYYNTEPFYEEMKDNISRMKAEGVQFIIAQMHWGNEYQLQESDYQREIAQELCNMGIDAIIGGHPHCEQPIDVFEAAGGHHMFCIFSEGNALSNQRTYLMDEMPTGHTEDGSMITLTLHQDSKGDVSLKDIDLLPTWVYRYSDDAGSKYFILPLDDVANIESTTGIADIKEEAQASYDRTVEELGPGLKKAREAFGAAASAVPETENLDGHSEIGLL